MYLRVDLSNIILQKAPLATRISVRCEAFAPVSDASIFDCSAVEAQSIEIVLNVPAPTMVKVSVMDARMQDGPSSRRSYEEYEPFANWSVAVVANGRQYPYTN